MQTSQQSSEWRAKNEPKPRQSNIFLRSVSMIKLFVGRSVPIASEGDYFEGDIINLDN